MTILTTQTIGIDVGDRHSDFCSLSPEGEVLVRGRVRTNKAAIEAAYKAIPRARIVLEVGTHSPWMSHQLEEFGHEVFVANARMLPFIYANDRKNDRTDAERLARLGRLDPELLSPLRHRNGQAQADLAVVRARHALVRARSQLVNHVRGSVKSSGSRLVNCSTDSFHRQAREQLPDERRLALDGLLDAIEALTRQIKEHDKKIERLSVERYPVTQHLRQVPGVGPITALTFALVIDDPRRFASSRTVGAYLGLTPRQDESGRQSPELGITKAGNSLLRSLLVQASHCHLSRGPDTDLQRWGMNLAGRGAKNAKKRAVVAMARKLAVLLHRLWITGEVYEPLRNARRLASAQARSQSAATVGSDESGTQDKQLATVAGRGN